MKSKSKVRPPLLDQVEWWYHITQLGTVQDESQWCESMHDIHQSVLTNLGWFDLYVGIYRWITPNPTLILSALFWCMMYHDDVQTCPYMTQPMQLGVRVDPFLGIQIRSKTSIFLFLSPKNENEWLISPQSESIFKNLIIKFNRVLDAPRYHTVILSGTTILSRKIEYDERKYYLCLPTRRSQPGPFSLFGCSSPFFGHYFCCLHLHG